MFEDLEGGVLVFFLGVLLLVAAFILGLIAIWSVGPVASKLGGTAAICGIPGFLLTLFGGLSAFG